VVPSWVDAVALEAGQVSQDIALEFLETRHVVGIGLVGYEPISVGIGQSDVEAVEAEVESQDVLMR
jgi:hypothetical protein